MRHDDKTRTIHTRAHYLRLRRKFKPAEVRLIFVAESPPASGKYFYDITGTVTEPLFAAIMRDVLGQTPRTKTDGLRAFQDAGYTLVDATYTPVNRGLTNRERDNRILEDYPSLKQDLAKLTQRKPIPILLVKANVCRLLEERLVADGFNVINKGTIVPFPASGQQGRFRTAATSILRRSIR